MVVLDGKIAFRGPPTECGLLGLSGIPFLPPVLDLGQLQLRVKVELASHISELPSEDSSMT